MFPPQIGQFNDLVFSEEHEAGILLDGGEDFGSILLPKRYVPESLNKGDEIKVFLYLDSEDRLIATTENPKAIAGEFAYLEVIDSTRAGSFLDWGLPKDLLLPFGEQPRRSRVGDYVVVFIYLDEVSGRLVASSKLKKFVSKDIPSHLRTGNKVSILTVQRTDIGIRAIVNGTCWGFLKGRDTSNLEDSGQRLECYVNRIREDGLLDLSLDPPGYSRIPSAADQLLNSLESTEEKFLGVHDKSSPESIKEFTGMSKKVFKQAVGKLYKEGKIKIETKGISLT